MGIDLERFQSDRTVQGAILFYLAILGESVKQLTDDFRERHADVQWREVAGLRDVIMHRYHRLRLDLVWDTVTGPLPQLVERLQAFLVEFPGEEAEGD